MFAPAVLAEIPLYITMQTAYEFTGPQTPLVDPHVRKEFKIQD